MRSESRCDCGEMFVARSLELDLFDELRLWRKKHEVCQWGYRLMRYFKEQSILDELEKNFVESGGTIHDCGCMEGLLGGLWVACEEHEH